MKRKSHTPRWAARTAFFVATVGTLIFSGCSSPVDDIIDDVNTKPDTEQPDDTKKDDVFIDLDNSQDNHVLSVLGFSTYPDHPVIWTGIGSSTTPFKAEIDDNGNTEVTISMTYDGTTNDYVLESYKNMDNVILAPEPKAVKLSVKIKDADTDNTVFDIDDSSLDYVHIQSMEFGIPSSGSWCRTPSDDQEHMLEETNGVFYYHAYYMRQFDNLFNTFKDYGTDVSILEVNKETGESTDISNRHISKDWYNTNLPYDEETNGVNQDSLKANYSSFLALSGVNKEYVVTGTFRVNILSVTQNVKSQELTNNGIALGTNPSSSYRLTLP